MRLIDRHEHIRVRADESERAAWWHRVERLVEEARQEPDLTKHVTLCALLLEASVHFPALWRTCGRRGARAVVDTCMHGPFVLLFPQLSVVPMAGNGW
jgi:hypothetical protein